MKDEPRPDPDALLAQVQREENQGKRGRLFLFLGMCPGVGKTYAMLLAARQRKKEGLNVLVGVVETHGRVETEALLEGMEVLPRRKLSHGGHVLEEFDLDTALARRPDLLLVDELAHTNAPGTRHRKRYQDVIELLDAGIDVCTTVNVQHIESQVDIVRQITGVAVMETVPDSMLDRAHEIQLVDLSVEKLMQRLAEGKVYLGERAQAAADGFFREGNLTALRELALRFTAERVDRDLEDIRRARRVNSPWKTNARLLVGVGPTPYSESLIRWTRRASGRLGCPWLAVWVERTQPLTPQQQDLLARGLGLARKLGGEVVHATGHDVAETLLQVARERNVSQIIVGKPDKRSRWKSSLADQLIAGSGDIDVCVVRPLIGRPPATSQEKVKPVPTHAAVEYGKVFLGTAVLTAICWGLRSIGGYTMPAMVFLFGIVLAALKFSRGAVLMMATLCALAWNYFFIPPRFTLQIQKPEDVVMLVLFFVVALAMGHLTARLRKREVAERRRQMETDALLRVTQSAALAPETGKGLAEALRIIDSVLDADTALVVRRLDHTLPSEVHPASTFIPEEQEFGVAAWAYGNKQTAGRFTDTLPQSQATWFPLQTATSTMGVLGVRTEGGGLDFVRRQAIEAFALQLALVLEKEHFIQAVNQAELIEKSERLRRTLLDSVSHELKTPLAVIRAAVDGMGGPASDPYVSEIDTATRRLQRLVDGLLQMTRLESQIVEPQLEWTDVTEIVDEATFAVGDILRTHPVELHLPEEFPFVKTDHALVVQALANILHNAAVYTPVGTIIEISARHAEGKFHLAVRDHGKGLPVGEESRVFGKFYRAPGSPAGGTGLGLSIARGFIRALGGDITAWNHPSGGAVFEIAMTAEFMDPRSKDLPMLVSEIAARQD
ncbi:sensor histidine kinase KdpD [Luteolibacter ambystomatis]|uniref:histidine kinase n=1 Tax=Luteolibacter ambystomatis TaxID=2824561 RepID=A0A975G752_9BACT|nr:sensor histidine kinase KdpD [Luteolibacter ambystomatis]QUE50033.1 sensor histidine kinase KdpD [Luteolibacter ambystomatis]